MSEVKNVDPLLSMAACRVVSVKVGTLTARIREPKVSERLHYSELYRKDKAEAMAYLLARSVIKDDSDEPRFTPEEAARIANGSSRVALTLVNAILDPEEEENIKNA